MLYTHTAMQFKPQLAAMKFPHGDHLMRQSGAELSGYRGREAAGCEGGMQLGSTMISPLGTWRHFDYY